ncbi:MAG: M48 family metallopeptidase [Patescibacteria group bacterium]
MCHLVEFNHSRAFWKLVEREVPNWKTLRKELKKTMVQLGEGGSGILRA